MTTTENIIIWSKCNDNETLALIYDPSIQQLMIESSIGTAPLDPYNLTTFLFFEYPTQWTFLKTEIKLNQLPPKALEDYMKIVYWVKEQYRSFKYFRKTF